MRINRRRFLQAAAAGAVAAAHRQTRAQASLPPSERLNIAGIGLGGQGKNDIDRAAALGHNIVALCDADRREPEPLAEAFPKAPIYSDYRVMLEKQSDIDAVVIATPDHHHALAATAAMSLGKHVYCEKPLAHSVYEARTMADRARETGVATQMGNSGQASDRVRERAEIIGDGAIGPVREVHVWTDRPVWPQGIARPGEEHAVPEELDWNLWLGPAPERPFNRIYHPFRWRGWWDFGTGALGDIGCHRFDGIFRALDLMHPAHVEASSTELNGETFPHASLVYYDFPEREGRPPVRLTWYDGGLKPPQPAEFEGAGLGANGVLYVGDHGKLLNGRLLPKSLREDYSKPEPRLPRSPGHWEEWIAACKGGAPAGANFDWAGPLTAVVLLGNVALKTGKRLAWDGANGRVTNHDAANQLLQRSYRNGWALG